MKLMHTTEVKSLIELQAKDRALDEMAAKIASAPGEMESLKADFEEKKSAMSAAHEALVKLQVEKKSREVSIAAKEEEIRKHQRDLNSIKDNEAFKAMLAEIERAKKEQDELETGVLGILEEIDKAAAEDKLSQQAVRKLQEETDLKIKAIEAVKTEAESSLTAAKASREELAAKIDAAVLEKYGFIRSQRKGLAIVCVKEDKTGKISCGGCNMGLTAQKIVDIKTKDALVFCEDCQRMIYLEKTVYAS